MQRATIDDVAALAGVSIKTVSRVVNQEPNVRDVTRAKVERAIADLNYHPNLSARNLASQRARLIALIYDDPASYENPSAGFVMRMQMGALSACRTADYRLVIYPCDIRKTTVGAELQAMLEHARPQGVILAAPLSNMQRVVRAIVATGTPMVRLSPGTQGGKLYSVATNDREISAEMTRYLASLGHRRIAFIKGHPNHRAVANRYLGYLDGLQQCGLELAQQLVENGDNSFASGEVAGGRLMKLEDPPTAIFAANDDMAAGVIRAARLLGVDIPGQLSVAGCDDISLARQLCPTLTTIRQPLSSMAERAALVLIGNAHDESPLQGAEIVPATIEIRESTGPAPC
ncbi:MAG: LacI family DNA-binding transcriptional regulator [Gammaproteobacteria bacterium]|nr:LacI family DNA-binding transcriptional regulator [Gammaproteobacteria bacterium]MDH4256350.1 LacI family DNA-binding transcriptional regulator [Gammaproteobacteria bacterium]MDH5272325.1 LacI family DNA-binding transcriptional regulator [Gammaproteobacteria bacterium]